MKSRDVEKEIFQILCKRGGAETSGALLKTFMANGLNKRRFFRALKRLYHRHKVQRELLRDGHITRIVYSIRNSENPGLFDLCVDSIGEKMLDYLENYDKQLDQDAKVMKISKLLAYAQEIDEVVS